MKITDQKKLAKMLTQSDIDMITKEVMKKGDMSGNGFMDVIKKIKNTISPIVQNLGPTVLKSLILPLIKQKLSGNGLRTAGMTGSGLRVTGQKGKGMTRTLSTIPKRKMPKRSSKGTFTLG